MLPELVTAVPGPQSRELSERLRRAETRNVTYVGDEFPIFWKRASGANVWDVDGNRFIDLTSAFGVAGLGHTNPEIAEALREQSDDLLHGMGDVHPTELKVALCERLSEVTFGRWNGSRAKTTLGNSGFEAVEAALKTALLKTGKPGVITFRGGYHGLGYGALEATAQAYFRNPFEAQLGKFSRPAEFPHDGDSLDRFATEIEGLAAAGDVGCILVEPTQGRGGIVVPPDDFLPTLRELCNRHGMLLVLDEIYTGFNRTGRMFACEHTGVVPDIICLGKALTSGFPLSACVGRADVMDAWPESTGEAIHTSTFLGNPVGCAMALASLEIHLRPETAMMVNEAGEHLTTALKRIDVPSVREVRGRGLMMGVELVTDNGQANGELGGKVVTEALRHGVLVLSDGPGGNVVAFTPPFGIGKPEIDYAVEVVAGILGEAIA